MSAPAPQSAPTHPLGRRERVLLAVLAAALAVVLLNVDNPRWQPEIDRYDVNGIPQLELFNANGTAIGRSLGARSAPELEALSSALIAQTPLPALPGVGNLSNLGQGATATTTAMAGPRSHG